ARTPTPGKCPSRSCTSRSGALRNGRAQPMVIWNTSIPKKRTSRCCSTKNVKAELALYALPVDHIHFGGGGLEGQPPPSRPTPQNQCGEPLLLKEGRMLL